MNILYLFKFYAPIAVFAFFLTILVVLFVLYIFPKIGLMDRPQNYGILRKPIPYYGGVAIYFSVVLSLLLFAPWTMQLFALLLSSTLIFLVGFLDDLFSIKPIFRLLAQALVALLLVSFGIEILTIQMPFLGAINLDSWSFDLFGQQIHVFSALFIVFWLMLVMNAMNFIDGIPGLNSGVTGISALTIFILSVHPLIHENPDAQAHVAIIALVVSMVALAFLFFDFPKPALLMGDTGSTFFGFMLAVLAIYSGGKIATLVLVLGIPLLDLIWVVFRRTFIEKKKFWQGDLKHFHHRLMYFGLSKRQVVLFYLFFSLIFGALAVIFVDTNQKFFVLSALVVLIIIFALMVVVGTKFENYEMRKFTKSDYEKYADGFLFLSRKVWTEIGVDPWSEENFLKDFENKWSFSRYVFWDGRIIAVMVASIKDGHPYVNKLAVLPEYRRFGLGKALLNEFENILEEKGFKEYRLSVNILNRRANRFYEKQGFDFVEEKKTDRGVMKILCKKV